MLVNTDTLKKIAHGAERIFETENGVEFSRFTDDEIKHYDTMPTKIHAYTTASIELRFKTDATCLSMKVFTKQQSGRTFFALDVMKNDEYIGSIKNFEYENLKGSYYSIPHELGNFEGNFELGEGVKEIRIILPWSCNLFIKEMHLENATFIDPIPKKDIILMYGDSITHGFDTRHPMNAYAVRLSHALDMECYNKAIGGEVFEPCLANYKHTYEPKIITVAYGTNDWSNAPIEDFDTKCKEFVDLICQNYKTSKIFFITPIWRKDYEGPSTSGVPFTYISEKINEFANKYCNAICIDGFDFIEKEEEYFADLSLHPNDEGFEQYFKNLYKEIKKHI